MTVKAALQIVLMADDVVVAESTDSVLWQQVLASVTEGRSLLPQARLHGVGETAEHPTTLNDSPTSESEAIEWADGALEALASDLRLDSVAVQAGCDPTVSAPYLHLDLRAWEAFKRNTGERGRKTVAPVAMAATLLLLWFRHSQSKTRTVTLEQAQAVLRTIDLRDKNAPRGLKNCDWLQTRDDGIKLNPAKYSNALAAASAFCSHQQVKEWEPEATG